MPFKLVCNEKMPISYKSSVHVALRPQQYWIDDDCSFGTTRPTKGIWHTEDMDSHTYPHAAACPFCHSANTRVVELERRRWTVVCNQCAASGPVVAIPAIARDLWASAGNQTMQSTDMTAA